MGYGILSLKGGGMMRFRKIYVEISNLCNLSCAFCPGTNRKPGRMTREDMAVLLPKLRPYTEYLYFHLMGEPTLHPKLPLFIARAKEKGFTPILTTNGSLLGRCSDGLLSSLPHKINISLHAPSANPAFADDKYLDNCISFAKKASALGTIVVLRLWNLNSKEESENTPIVEKLKEAFNEWVPFRGGVSYRLSERIFLEWGEHFDWPDPEAPSTHPDAEAFCYALRDQVGILVDGTAVPCCLDADGNLALGNLFDSTLDEIINSERAKRIYDGFSCRRASEDLCRRCGYARRFVKK